ncbi:MAG: LAO/AO transport system kinase [Halioglobus sp.]|jgi:LAO/AO transport system kinase
MGWKNTAELLVNSSDPTALAYAVRNGDRSALAIALNLLDDSRTDARANATAFLKALQSDAENDQGRLIGLTGPPGVGKSSLTGALISTWRQRGLRVGVLAVDPSSPISGGALLGDRLRMLTGPEDDGVFIRSLSNRGEFGGISAEVWPMSLVMLATFDVVVVETVGVGQREVDIANLCDTTCYVAQPGSGDSVQFIKAGILEVPHVLVVNKEDMGAVATRTLSELSAVAGGIHPDGNWEVPVLSTSATGRTGIEALADTLEQHHAMQVDANVLGARRRRSQASWVFKRLEGEFGRSGIKALGGETQLLQQMQAEHSNLFEQYETYRQQLQAGR